MGSINRLLEYMGFEYQSNFIRAKIWTKGSMEVDVYPDGFIVLGFVPHRFEMQVFYEGYIKSDYELYSIMKKNGINRGCV